MGYLPLCDKCGKPVHPSNDAGLIEAEVVRIKNIKAYFPVLAMYRARHFLPEGNCEGSPSRAQYIKGQPKDKRGYSYNKDLKPLYRQAFTTLQSKKFA